MQLKTSEFQSLFTDGLNGLAGEVQLRPDVVTYNSALTWLPTDISVEVVNVCVFQG